MDINKLREVTSEKYKFLFLTEFGKKYDILSITTDIADWEEKEDRISIKEMEVYFNLDYNGSIHGDSQSLGLFLDKVSSDCFNFINEYPFNPTKLKFDGAFEDFSIGTPLFLNVDYALDDSHKVNLVIKILFYPNLL